MMESLGQFCTKLAALIRLTVWNLGFVASLPQLILYNLTDGNCLSCRRKIGKPLRLFLGRQNFLNAIMGV